MHSRISSRSALAALLVSIAASVGASAQDPPPTSGIPPITTTGSVPSRPSASVTGPLTLKDAIALALQAQPDLYASAADLEAARQRVEQVESRFLPTVTPLYTFQNSYSFTDRQSFTTGPGGTPVPLPRSSTRETRQGEVGLRYTVYDMGRRDLSARQARQSLRATEFSVTDVRQLVITDVATTYYNALRGDALVKVSESQVARAQNTRDLIAAQISVGVAAQKDIYQAEADLLNAQVQLLQARNSAEIAQANLRNAIGLTGTTRLALADVSAPTDATPATAALTGDAPTPIPAVATEPTINEYVGVAYRTRPDLARTQQTLDVSRTNVQLSKIEAGVSVTSDVAAGYRFTPDLGNDRQITAQVTYPLFDGGLARSQVRQSQAEVRGGEARLESVRQGIAVEVEQALRSLVDAKARVPAAFAAQQAAQVNYDAAVESLREGVGTTVDVITAQAQLVQAQTSYVQAIYDFYTADARLARSVGQAERIANR